MKPKVALIGAGSLFFGRQFLCGMLNSDALKHGTAALVDSDTERLGKMVKLAQMANESLGSPLTVEYSCNHEDVLKDADFVVFSFANNGAMYRGMDCAIAEKYGIRMNSGDTIGPGGVFRAMRELPTALAVAKDVERLCPNAWVISYTNPAGIIGLGLAKYTNVKSLAICDGLRMPYVKENYLELIGCKDGDADKLTFVIAGTNHFTWLLDIRYNGKDVSGDLRKSVEHLARTGPENNNYAYSLALWDAFGCYPAIIDHNMEFFPFWQGRGKLEDYPAKLEIFSVDARYTRHAAMWEEVDAYLSGELEIGQLHKIYQSDLATDVIEAMWTDSRSPYFANVLNNGTVPNLPDDAYLELLCDMSMDGPKPRPALPFPVGLRSWQMRVIDTNQLTAEAIVKQDRSLLRRAMLTDPLVVSIADTDAMISEVLAAQSAALPPGW